MAEITYIDAIRDALLEEMERLPTMIVLGEDIQEGGVFRVTDGMLERFGPERVLDTPLAESSIVGVAIGLATNGCVPVAEMQFADFAFPAFNQIISEAAKWRYRSNNGWGCPIVVRAPSGGGIRGALYPSQSICAMYARGPGLIEVALTHQQKLIRKPRGSQIRLRGFLSLGDEPIANVAHVASSELLRRTA